MCQTTPLQVPEDTSLHHHFETLMSHILYILIHVDKVKEGKAIPVTGREGP
jgi:hypothetical protein